MNVSLAGTSASFSDGTDLSCQRIKLIGKRQLGTAFQRKLIFADHVHELDAGFVALMVSQTAGLC